MKQKIKFIITIVLSVLFCLNGFACAGKDDQTGKDNQTGKELENNVPPAQTFKGVLSEEKYSSTDDAFENFFENEFETEFTYMGNEKVKEFSESEIKSILAETESDGITKGEEYKVFCVHWLYYSEEESEIKEENIYTAGAYLFTYGDGTMRYFVPTPKNGYLCPNAYLYSVFLPLNYSNSTVKIKEKIDEQYSSEIDISCFFDGQKAFMIEDDKTVDGDELLKYRCQTYYKDCGNELKSASSYDGDYKDNIEEDKIESKSSNSYDGSSYKADEVPSAFGDYCGDVDDFNDDGKISVEDLFLEQICNGYMFEGMHRLVFEKTEEGFSLKKGVEAVAVEHYCNIWIVESDYNITSYSGSFDVKINAGRAEKMTFHFEYYEDGEMGESRSLEVNFSDFGKTSVNIPTEVESLLV